MKKFAMTLTMLLVGSLVAALFGATPASAAQSPTRAHAIVAPASTPAKKVAKKVRMSKVERKAIRAHAAQMSTPSKWRGIAVVHPSGQTIPRAVSRWANMVSAIMAEHKIPAAYLSGILAQIQQESYGDPNAVNLWDSNARRGTPSKGLLQVIAPTYTFYAKRGLRPAKFQTLPYANIWAGLNYAKNRYGMAKFASWSAGQNQGY
ncbi:MAG: transglycosylase SLT domain-containing protein [Candidatus Nanopelagicales bacterium]